MGYFVYTKKFIIGVFLLIGIAIHIYKHIETYRWENYLNILDSFLLACLLFLLVAKYLTVKAKRQERACVLFV